MHFNIIQTGGVAFIFFPSSIFTCKNLFLIIRNNDKKQKTTEEFPLISSLGNCTSSKNVCKNACISFHRRHAKLHEGSYYAFPHGIGFHQHGIFKDRVAELEEAVTILMILTVKSSRAKSYMSGNMLPQFCGGLLQRCTFAHLSSNIKERMKKRIQRFSWIWYCTEKEKKRQHPGIVFQYVLMNSKGCAVFQTANYNIYWCIYLVLCSHNLTRLCSSEAMKRDVQHESLLEYTLMLFNRFFLQYQHIATKAWFGNG